MTLPLYNPDAECPKCGHTVISTRHERAGAPFAEFAVATADHLRRVPASGTA